MSEIGQKLISIVRRIAAERPDHVYVAPSGTYGMCLYVHDGKPSCIIGQALWEAGLIDASMERSDDNGERFHHIIDGLGLDDLTEDERRWLAEVQFQQDTGHSWGIAVMHANEKYTLVA